MCRGVDACGVVGVPDPEFDDRPLAFVVAKPVAEAGLVAVVEAHLDAHLGRLKHPCDIRLVDSLPVSETSARMASAVLCWSFTGAANHCGICAAVCAA